MNSHVDQSHVAHRVADFLWGRLAAEEARGVQQHLELCGECAAEFQFAARFQTSGLTGGDAASPGRFDRAEMHVDEARLVELAEHDQPQEHCSASESIHLIACASCRHELSVLSSIPLPPELEQASSQHQPRRVAASSPRRARFRLPNWGWGMGLAAAAAAVVLMMTLRSGDLPNLEQFVVRDSLPVRLARDTTDLDDFERQRHDGLVAYRDRDYGLALTALQAALDQQPQDPELQLYLGSSRFLSGDAAGAVPLLRQALSVGGDGLMGQEARWQLANALLQTGDVERAAPLLQELVQLQGAHTTQARVLLEALSEAGHAP